MKSSNRFEALKILEEVDKGSTEAEPCMTTVEPKYGLETQVDPMNITSKTSTKSAVQERINGDEEPQWKQVKKSIWKWRE